MASVGKDVTCVFCLQPGTSVSDSRKLPCGHVGCFPCIENVNKATKEFECSTCSFKCEVVDVHKLEIAAYNCSVSDGSDQLMCGICEEKPAVVFCVKCQKLLCAMHEKDDDEGAVSGGYAVHYHVKMGAYVKNKDLYIRHYCRRHSDTETIQACNNCLDTFCRSCDVTVKCSTTNDLHKLSSLPDVVTVLLTKVNELQASLDKRNARCQSLLKSTYQQMESFEKVANQMLEEVDRIMEEQIEQIKLEVGKLKDEIANYKEDFSKKAEESVQQILVCCGQAVKGLSGLNTFARIKSAGHMVEGYSVIEGSINAVLDMEITPFYLTRKHLVPTGSFRKAEVQLHQVEFSAIEYRETPTPNYGSCHSVRWISSDRLATASSLGIELRDRELNVIRSIRIPYVNSVIRYKDELLVLQYMNNGTKSIQLYSMQLVKIRDIVSFATDSDYTQIGASDGKIVASDHHNRCLHIWTSDGKPVTKISLSDRKIPYGICITTDGCVLISDCAEAGTIGKYSLEGYCCWRLFKMKYPEVISESGKGNYYVKSKGPVNSSLYLLSENGSILKTISCDHLPVLSTVYGIAVIDDCFAAACFDGVKLFQLTFL